MKAFFSCMMALVLWLIGMLFFRSESLAQAPKETSTPAAVKPREFEEFVKNLPKGDLLTLRGNKAVESAMVISRKIEAAELRKESTFRCKVERVEPWQYADSPGKAWRVQVKGERIKHGSVGVDLSAWVHVRSDPAGIMAKVRSGQELIVTGQINRSDITINNGSPALNVDLDATSLTAK